MINLHRKYVIITNQWGGFVKKKKKIVISSKIIIIIIAACLFISLVINIYLFSIKKAVNMLDENIVFFGDSITEVYKVDEFFPKRNVINSGISGDRTENLLERMDDVYRYNPSKVFLLIGINDLNREKSIDEITKNIQKIINNIKANRKYTKIYIESVYPINRNVFEEKDYSFNEKINNDIIKELNNKIKILCKENKIQYIDVYNSLLDNDGNLKDIYTNEGLHLSDLGYFKVTTSLNKYINE